MPATQHNIQFIDIANDVVRVVQLTDTHLCHARGGTLLGMDTDHSLQAVLDLVKKERQGIYRTAAPDQHTTGCSVTLTS